MTCEELDHKASCALEALRWWSSSDKEGVRSTENGRLMCKKEGRDSSREAVKIMEKKITEEQPGYSALTDSRSTVKEKTDTELTEGIKKTKK